LQSFVSYSFEQVCVIPLILSKRFLNVLYSNKLLIWYYWFMTRRARCMFHTKFTLKKYSVSGLHNSTTYMLCPPEFIIKNLYTMLCYKEGKIVTKTLLSSASLVNNLQSMHKQNLCNEKLFAKVIFKKSIKMPSSKKTSYPHYLCGPPC
jgi:hypothetical protein